MPATAEKPAPKTATPNADEKPAPNRDFKADGPRKKGEPQEEAQRLPWRASLKAFVVRRWLPLLVGGSLAVHALLALVVWSSLSGGGSVPSREVPLGEFAFVDLTGGSGLVEAAEFELHISLIEEVEREVRRRMKERQHRLEQDIEQLVRQANGADFEDPTLSELKRQLQEQINQTLGLRGVEDVIITDLTVHRRPGGSSVAEVDDYEPWKAPDDEDRGDRDGDEAKNDSAVSDT